MENELESLLEHPGAVPLELDLNLDFTRGPGAGWSRLVAVLARKAAQQDSLFSRPLAAAPLYDALISACCTPLGTAGAMSSNVRSWAPRPVNRAVEVMHVHPELAHSPASLAATAGISVRSLHEAFRRHLGMTPMPYHGHRDRAPMRLQPLAPVRPGLPATLRTVTLDHLAAGGHDKSTQTKPVTIPLLSESYF